MYFQVMFFVSLLALSIRTDQVEYRHDSCTKKSGIRTVWELTIVGVPDLQCSWCTQESHAESNNNNVYGFRGMPRKLIMRFVVRVYLEKKTPLLGEVYGAYHVRNPTELGDFTSSQPLGWVFQRFSGCLRLLTSLPLRYCRRAKSSGVSRCDEVKEYFSTRPPEYKIQ